MIRFILSFLFLLNIAYASDKYYYIQLGSFKQLKVLEKSVNALPYALRSHVTIVHSKSWYVPFAYKSKQKNRLLSKAREYKKYFPDAYITRSSSIFNYPIVHSYAPIASHPNVVSAPSYDTTPIYYPPASSYRSAPAEPAIVSYSNSSSDSYSNVPSFATTSVEPIFSEPIQEVYQNVPIPEAYNVVELSNVVNPPMAVAPEVPLRSTQSFFSSSAVSRTMPTSSNIKETTIKRYKHFNKKMLSGQTYYLVYKATNESPNLLIKVMFENHQVTYRPVIGDMEMTKANYLIDNNKLYMFADEFTKNGAYSTLDEHRNNHFLVSSWVDGKKLNTLRYYYRLNDAKEYLGIKKSNGLASTLEEGAFDSGFLPE